MKVRSQKRSTAQTGTRVLLAAGLFLLGAGCGTTTGYDHTREQTHRVPNFSLDLLDGGSVSLADLAGKTVVLDFWATWCTPCVFQVPELNQFYETHRTDADVLVYGVSVDLEGPELVKAWVEEQQVRYPILLGGEQLSRDIGVMGIPTLFVITPEGLVQMSHSGLVKAETLDETLRGRDRETSAH
jgi:thiol-disulfide isomerase/thioredoxin